MLKNKRINFKILVNAILQKIILLKKNRVLNNVLLVGSITLFIKFIGFYKETIVAANFGLSLVLDTFFIAYLIPGFIQSVFLNSFKSVFIPNYVAELKTGNNMASFQATGFLITALISIFFILIAILFTDTYLRLFFDGHDETYYQLVKSQFYYVLPCIFFWGFSSLLSGLLNINEEFRYSSFYSIFIPLTIIICLVFFKENLGNMVLAIGSLIGSITAFLYLLYICIKKKILKLSLPKLNNVNTQIMFRQVPIKMTSSVFSSLHSIIDQYFAAQLFIGSIAALNYASKIPAFTISLIVIAMSSVLLPHFSKLVMNNKPKAFQELFKMLKILFILSAVVAIVGILTSDFFIALFFERKEFTTKDTELVANLQKIILIYIPFKISGELLVNFLTSINKNIYMAIVSFISVILNVILNFVLINIYGVFGIAIATTTVVIIRNSILFLFTLKQKKTMYNN
jgi:putative peptidoglycan lipid II flippase